MPNMTRDNKGMKLSRSSFWQKSISKHENNYDAHYYMLHNFFNFQIGIYFARKSYVPSDKKIVLCQEDNHVRATNNSVNRKC